MSQGNSEDVIYCNNINRGERVEVAVDSYKSADAKVKREIEDTKIKKDPQTKITGGDAPWSRRCRLTAVCLGLLCILLLTVITLLWIMFNNLTAERDQLHTSYTSMTAERDQLQTSYTNLTKERDQLQTSYTNLTAERNQLHTSYTNLTAERDQLKTNYTNLTAERDQLQTSYTNLTTERNQLQTSYNSLTLGNEQLQSINTNLTVEKDQLQTRYDSMTARKDQLRLERDEVLRGLLVLGNDGIQTEGVWKWVDGSALTTDFWGTGEPSIYPDEDCAITGSKYSTSDTLTWADYPCGYSHFALCEKKF
ncbi:uncharacterized protein [Salminus brasiliensis]|uniref:uncharacterized protein n=1 Tax=Salminus brasiliensis TaxID=930266 RepID=UPI003B82CD25